VLEINSIKPLKEQHGQNCEQNFI